MHIHEFAVIQPVWVPYPTEVQTSVEEVLYWWKLFCTLPLEIKNKFEFREGAQNGDAGYEYRTEKGETHDSKETFHVTRGELDRLFSYTLSDRTGIGLSFLVAVEELEKTIRSLILSFTADLKEQFSLPADFYHNVLNSSDRWSFRFLHYLPGAEKEIIAAPHIDRGGFAPYLGESLPGLEYLGEDGVWRAINIPGDSTVILPGMMLQYVSKGKVKALCHRVVATPESKREGRFSAVCFVDMANTPVYDKVRFGRSQDLTPGLNYTQDWDEFKKMFR